MKRLFTISIAFVLTLGYFTGCGDKNEDSGMSKKELNECAETLYKAGNSALTNMDEQGLGLGGDTGFGFSSDGSYTGTPATFEENSQTFIDYMSDYYSDYKEHEWVLYIKDGFVEEAYCAETFDSEVVGSFAFDVGTEVELDVDGKSLNDIKSEIEDKYNDMIETP